MGAMTFLHGVFAIYMGLMLVAHVFAGGYPACLLATASFNGDGNVTENYVKHHHEKWYQEIKDTEKLEKEQELKQNAKSNKRHISTS